METVESMTYINLFRTAKHPLLYGEAAEAAEAVTMHAEPRNISSRFSSYSEALKCMYLTLISKLVLKLMLNTCTYENESACI